MAVVTGHTCRGGGYAGSRPIEERKAECRACQRHAAAKAMDAPEKANEPNKSVERARHLAHCFYASRVVEICKEEGIGELEIAEGFRLSDIDRRVRAELRSIYGDPAYGAWPAEAAVRRASRFAELNEQDKANRLDNLCSAIGIALSKEVF